MTLQNNLKKLGLNNKEIEIYLTLIKNGAVSPTDLSKMTKINRATIYSSAKNLQNKGLVIEDISGTKTLFVPAPADQLEQIIKRGEKELEEKKDIIRNVVDELNLITSQKNYPVPKIRFVDESNMENFMHENMEKWIQSMRRSDSTWWGIQDHTFSENFKEFNDWYWKRPYVSGIKMNLISNNTKIENEIKLKYEKKERDVRITDSMNFSSSIWVGGEYLIMVVTKNKPFYMFEIHDAALADNMREVFKNTWENTKK
jgi:sugar-specific transcriptional regulator TrmB